ncbi:hypothetical protein AHOG_25620 [Actinoalloteichus hoggarensis]|uniref:Uncharacterized protein n=1 Tax=Actinoalloteichus hoggarensis TaxID=1470176 RepID=A0A221WB43_9PSEU|nr:hypothetical protein AHOG_25620 [Actinoalloteichus hoggarensis]
MRARVPVPQARPSLRAARQDVGQGRRPAAARTPAAAGGRPRGGRPALVGDQSVIQHEPHAAARDELHAGEPAAGGSDPLRRRPASDVADRVGRGEGQALGGFQQVRLASLPGCLRPDDARENPRARRERSRPSPDAGVRRAPRARCLQRSGRVERPAQPDEGRAAMRRPASVFRDRAAESTGWSAAGPARRDGGRVRLVRARCERAGLDGAAYSGDEYFEVAHLGAARVARAGAERPRQGPRSEARARDDGVPACLDSCPTSSRLRTGSGGERRTPARDAPYLSTLPMRRSWPPPSMWMCHRSFTLAPSSRTKRSLTRTRPPWNSGPSVIVTSATVSPHQAS